MSTIASTSSFTRQSARTALATGVVAFAFVAPLVTASATASEAPSAASAKSPTTRYTAQAVGPNDTSTRTLGIADNGDVLVAAGWQDSYVVSGTRARKLPVPAGDAQWSRAAVIAPNGTVYGSHPQGVYRWDRRGNGGSFRKIANADTNYASVQEANSAGTVAGCSDHYRVSGVFLGSFEKDAINELGLSGPFGNCRVTGLSNAGVASVSLDPPSYRTDDTFPKPFIATSKGLQALRVPTGATGSADGISPNGRYIVGRVFDKEGAANVSWLSTGRAPVALRGTDGLTPSFVTNQGVIVGTKDGRVVTWSNGRITDVTSAARLGRGVTLTSVAGVNSHGQLAVTATKADGSTTAMRVTPARGR